MDDNMHIDERYQARLWESFRWPMLAVAFLWLIHGAKLIWGESWGAWGLYPRKLWGLKGVLTSPLLHGDLPHLVSNSVPLLILGTLVVFFYKRLALRSVLMIYLLTGVSVWLLGRSVYHIGASGVVYGLVAFVFWNGIFQRSLQSIVLALIVTVLYSGYFMGILPNQEGISWESHLLGALVGIFTAYFYKEELEANELREPQAEWQEEPEEPKRFFLPRDAFDKTKAERLREEQEGREGGFSGWFSSSTWE